MEYYFKRYSQNHSEINKVPEDEGMISAKKKKHIKKFNQVSRQQTDNNQIHNYIFPRSKGQIVVP